MEYVSWHGPGVSALKCKTVFLVSLFHLYSSHVSFLSEASLSMLQLPAVIHGPEILNGKFQRQLINFKYILLQYFDTVVLFYYFCFSLCPIYKRIVITGVYE